MKVSFFSLITFALILFPGCSGKHLITDKNLRDKVEMDFKEKRKVASNRDNELFDFSESALSHERREAFQFLFTYMPLSDLADYDGSFLLANTDAALRARHETKWGEGIPDAIFMHYVLPVRVNNENLDSFRLVYYDEIHSRISGLDAMTAALEINHWCHEKVSYQPSDIRTSAPMSTILSARGRCGEESTFTVAALRVAGIPARQVYTPRWAHSDDNHAWVEFWVDGKWYYMGACEPEPVPDRGWFTEPARRAMLVHTKSVGPPAAGENIIISTPNYSVINTLSKYAVTKNIFVRVLDSDSNPVINADVDYQLYNYAEFYTIASVPTDSNGISRFETGLGDLLVWASKNERFSFSRISVNETDTIIMVLGDEKMENGYYEYDLGVPVIRAPFDPVPDSLAAINNKRLEEENRIRQKYIESWIRHEDARKIEASFPAACQGLSEIIMKSMGNWRQITSFLENAHPDDRLNAFRILSAISEKDLRDTPERILNDHLVNAVRYSENDTLPVDIYSNYILNPRIANEILTPWRGYFHESIDTLHYKRFKRDPNRLISFIDSSITINETDNYYGTPISPVGVGKLKISDRFSRDIFFVAMCRSLGIPARLEDGSMIPQYYAGGRWIDVRFGDAFLNDKSKGYISFEWDEEGPVPEYYLHFTLARFENGKYNTLGYDYNRRITDFDDSIALNPGYYMLVTGNRINDSRILSSVTFFSLDGNEHRKVNVKVRKDTGAPVILGKFETDREIILNDGKSLNISTLNKKGVVMIWIDPDREPTKHIFHDLPLLKKELDTWGGEFLFFYDPSGSNSIFDPSSVAGLPLKSRFIADTGFRLLSEFCGGLSCSTSELPLVIVVSKESNIMYRSMGYRIGIGEQILKSVR